MTAQRLQVLSRYRELLKLLKRLPGDKSVTALQEARQTIRSRRDETNPQQALEYAKELAARISFLKITTPRRPGEPLEGGRFVLQDGQLVKGEAEDKGARSVLLCSRRHSTCLFLQKV